ncbi:putative isomerase, Enoyl-CoA hydratase, 3-hydroxyacyl-CoA dehydrogenase [Helianthus anomalus]
MIGGWILLSHASKRGPLLLDVLEGFLKFEEYTPSLFIQGCHRKCNVLCSKRFRFKYLFAQQRSFQEIGETELGPHTSGNVRGLVARKRLAQAQAEKALSMIKGVLDYSEFRDVDMVIEAVIENVPLKQKIFSELEKVCPPHCIWTPHGPVPASRFSGIWCSCCCRKPKPDPQVFLILDEARRQVNIMPGGKPINITDQEVVEMILFAVVNEACLVEKLLSIFSY